MKEFTSCSDNISECLSNKRFSVAHLSNEEKTMNMHIHECYEVYYSISGGKQFLIDDRCYDIRSGDVFVINNCESHYLSQIDDYHERIVLSIFPEFLDRLSSKSTDLSQCFAPCETGREHRIRLSKEDQKRFCYLVYKITGCDGYGADLIETAAFLELMVLLNSNYQKKGREESVCYSHNESVIEIIRYINQHITEPINIAALSEHCYLSEGYLCRLFKAETGTTINKYLTARRISIAKTKLMLGCTAGEACEQSGFRDYTNFVRSFTKIVGVTPKKYGKFVNE